MWMIFWKWKARKFRILKYCPSDLVHDDHFARQVPHFPCLFQSRISKWNMKFRSRKFGMLHETEGNSARQSGWVQIGHLTFSFKWDYWDCCLAFVLRLLPCICLFFFPYLSGLCRCLKTPACIQLMLFPGGGLESQRANDDIRFRAGKMVFVAIIKPVDVVPSSFGDPIFCEDPETMSEPSAVSESTVGWNSQFWREASGTRHRFQVSRSNGFPGGKPKKIALRARRPHAWGDRDLGHAEFSWHSVPSHRSNLRTFWQCSCSVFFLDGTWRKYVGGPGRWQIWMLHAMSGVIRRVNKRGLKAFRAAKNWLRLLRFAEVRSIWCWAWAHLFSYMCSYGFCVLLSHRPWMRRPGQWWIRVIKRSRKSRKPTRTPHKPTCRSLA